MSKRYQQFLALWEEGHTLAGISLRLNISCEACRRIANRLDLSHAEPPPGYMSLLEAARRIHEDYWVLYNYAYRGSLKTIYHQGHRWVSMDQIQAWINDAPYREQARELLRKIAKHVSPPTPSR